MNRPRSWRWAATAALLLGGLLLTASSNDLYATVLGVTCLGLGAALLKWGL